MPGKRSRSTQAKSRLSMFDNPSQDRSILEDFRVLIGFNSTKYGGISPEDQCSSPTSPLDAKSFTRYSSGCGGVGLGILVADLDNKETQAMPIVSAKLMSSSTRKSGRGEDINGGKLSSSTLSPFEPANFLYACYLCRCRLSHQKDIYMYRGDKAFCSEECRYQQIVSDERKEWCASYASSFYACSSPMFTIDGDERKECCPSLTSFSYVPSSSMCNTTASAAAL